MPHDVNGKIVEIGQEVLIKCIVKQVYTGADYCNAQLETVESMHPDKYKTTITLNTRQFEITKDAEKKVA